MVRRNQMLFWFTVCNLSIRVRFGPSSIQIFPSISIWVLPFPVQKRAVHHRFLSVQEPNLCLDVLLNEKTQNFTFAAVFHHAKDAAQGVFGGHARLFVAIAAVFCCPIAAAIVFIVVFVAVFVLCFECAFENSQSNLLSHLYQTQPGAKSSFSVDQPKHFGCIVVLGKDHLFCIYGFLRIIMARNAYPSPGQPGCRSGKFRAGGAFVIINK